MECSRLRFSLFSAAKSTVRGIARRGVLALAVSTALAGCRLDMHIQPKYLPERPTDFFHDGRSERPMVQGTVARGHLRLDELLYTGRENGVESNRFPFPITRADLERGREQFNIFCTPCHDYTGNGNGMIVRRGFPHPPSYHIERLRNAPVGHFFDVMTNGFGEMYSYGSRISPEDRWRIAAYIRVLQLSQHASMQDVPANERQNVPGGPGPAGPGNLPSSSSRTGEQGNRTPEP
jgi:Cytochrome C oxidase, cbb3-type, subunit III